MPSQFYEGEDVPLVIEYEDSSGSLTDPDAAPTIDIIGPDGTAIVSATSMTSVEAGVYEYVWDTSTDADGTGEYVAEVSAEFSSETKITKLHPELL